MVIDAYSHTRGALTEQLSAADPTAAAAVTRDAVLGLRAHLMEGRVVDPQETARINLALEAVAAATPWMGAVESAVRRGDKPVVSVPRVPLLRRAAVRALLGLLLAIVLVVVLRGVFWPDPATLVVELAFAAVVVVALRDLGKEHVASGDVVVPDVEISLEQRLRPAVVTDALGTALAAVERLLAVDSNGPRVRELDASLLDGLQDLLGARTAASGDEALHAAARIESLLAGQGITAVSWSESEQHRFDPVPAIGFTPAHPTKRPALRDADGRTLHRGEVWDVSISEPSTHAPFRI